MQGRCAFQDFAVAAANEPLLIGRPHVAASRPEAGNHVSGDVLVVRRGKSNGLTQSS